MSIENAQTTEITLPFGFVHVYIGATLWRWYAVCLTENTFAISPCVYPSKDLALEKGSAACTALALKQKPEIDWTGVEGPLVQTYRKL